MYRHYLSVLIIIPCKPYLSASAPRRDIICLGEYISILLGCCAVDCRWHCPRKQRCAASSALLSMLVQACLLHVLCNPLNFSALGLDCSAVGAGTALEVCHVTNCTVFHDAMPTPAVQGKEIQHCLQGKTVCADLSSCRTARQSAPEQSVPCSSTPDRTIFKPPCHSCLTTLSTLRSTLCNLTVSNRVT
jgi:hypothetical protein